MGIASLSARLPWVDNLRTTIILLVINMHACVTYSHVGDWYVTEGPEPPMSAKIPFFFWQGHLQAFFMGLLFFLAGVFAHRSVERRGPAGFVRERLVRLGLPALLYMLVIHPLLVFVIRKLPLLPDWAWLGSAYANYLASGHVLSGNGPLWFALALLVFCLVLAGWRKVRPRGWAPNVDKRTVPGPARLLLLGCVLVAGTFAVRLFQPLGKNFLNFQLCFFVQYILAFAAGVAAGRHGWLERLAASRQARIAGWLGLVGGPILLGTVIALGDAPAEHGPNLYAGGWHPQAFGLALWEQLAGLGLGLGMLVLFRTWFNRENAISQWLSQRAFAVYVLHPPVLVGLTLLLRPLSSGLFIRVLFLTVLGAIGSYLVADLAKRTRVLGAIL